MAVSIIMTAVSGVLVTQLDSIVYTCSGEDACIIQLDFKNRQVRYMKYTSEYDNRWMTGEMSDFMAVAFRYLTAAANAPLWLERYPGRSADAEHAWGMDMHFGSRVKTSQGTGDYPAKWKVLIPRIMELADSFPELKPEQDQVPGNVATSDI